MGAELVDTLSGHTGRVWNVKWHPDGQTLASCGEDKTIRIWIKKGLNWKERAVLEEGHSKSIREVAWSPDGLRLASASFDATTAIWDGSNGSFDCTSTLEGHENEVKSVSWSKSGHFLATCSRDKSVWIWEIDNDDFECSAVLNAHIQDVKKLVWHPHTDTVASASYDNNVKLFKEDPADNEWINVGTLTSHSSTVWSLDFDGSGSRMISCSADQTLKIWREYLPGNAEGIATTDGYPTWKCVCTISGAHPRAIYDVSWCHKTGLIATACADDSIRIFKEDDNSDPHQPCFSLLTVIPNAHDQDVNCVHWNPTDPGVLASASDDSTIKIWRVSV